ncbi:putative ribonuclease H-like domain-containing protein [Tanacetum coccineum]
MYFPTETFYILRDFITFVENQLTKKVKAIRCDNGTEFKNSNLIELCGSNGIKRDYSVARTPQQNGVAERKNRTLIEAARTMLADSKLPTMFWTEAVSTACYVLNRVLVTRPHNKTPYELLSGKVPNISHLKPFGCYVTILNTSDHLGNFEGKAECVDCLVTKCVDCLFRLPCLILFVLAASVVLFLLFVLLVLIDIGQHIL